MCVIIDVASIFFISPSVEELLAMTCNCMCCDFVVLLFYRVTVPWLLEYFSAFALGVLFVF